jgi:hypothetical protein
MDRTGRQLAIAFSSEVGTGSHSNQVYADCVDLSAVENASKQENRSSRFGLASRELRPAHRFVVPVEVGVAETGRMKFLGATVALIASAAVFAGSATARDDGRYANSPLKPWFDSLRSGKGLCCSDADGSAVSDVDWESKDGHYRVRLEGQWIDVPDDAVITVPNRAGRTMVWPVKGASGISIRCFLPGSMI